MGKVGVLLIRVLCDMALRDLGYRVLFGLLTLQLLLNLLFDTELLLRNHVWVRLIASNSLSLDELFELKLLAYSLTHSRDFHFLELKCLFILFLFDLGLHGDEIGEENELFLE